jgi:suppressor of fused
MRVRRTAWHEIAKALNSRYCSKPNAVNIGGLRLTSKTGSDPFDPDMYYRADLEKEDDDRRRISPLDCVKIFKSDQDITHWHYVSFGFSDLYSVLNNQPNVSGYGFELTMRLERNSEEKTAPYWPVAAMTDLAQYVFSSGIVLNEFETVNLSFRIRNLANFNVTGAVLVPDPELGVLETETGQISMLQLYAITADEHRVLERWQSRNFVQLISKSNPLLITNPFRKSLLKDPEFKRLAEAGIAQDGSSLNPKFANIVKISHRAKQCVLEVSAEVVDNILIALEGRLPFNRDFKLIGMEDIVIFRTAKESSVDFDQENNLVLNLSKVSAADFAKVLKPVRGTYTFNSLPNFELVVTPFEIRRPDGQVLETIG